MHKVTDTAATVSSPCQSVSPVLAAWTTWCDSLSHQSSHKLARQQRSKTAVCVLRVAGAACQVILECYIYYKTKLSYKYKRSRRTPFQLKGALPKPEVAGILADLCHLTGGKGIASGQANA